MLPNIVSKFSKMDRIQNSDLENVGMVRSKRVIKSAYKGISVGTSEGASTLSKGSAHVSSIRDFRMP